LECGPRLKQLEEEEPGSCRTAASYWPILFLNPFFLNSQHNPANPANGPLTVAASRLITTIPDWYAHAAIKGA